VGSVIPGTPASRSRHQASPEGREVGVLDGQRGENGFENRVLGRLVERRHLADEDGHRPAVGDDVVEGEGGRVVRGPEAHDERPQERPADEVEGSADLVSRDAPHLRLGRISGQPLEIDHRQVEMDRGGHDLHRPALLVAEGGAQRLVAPRDLLQGAPEDAGLERAAEADRRRHVVEGRAPFELLQEPQPRLGERQWQRPAVARKRDDA
jgi:hypothetical protein